MHNLRFWAVAAAAAVLTVPCAGAEPERLFEVDVVALAGGQETPGLETLRSNHAGFAYTFANEENKKSFDADPEKYAVQLGGACARMGPLSGEGRTTIYAVHKDRLYIFASTDCRDTFRKHADRLLEGPDAAPAGFDAAAAQRGRELVELAVVGVGGASALDAVGRYEREVVKTQVSQGKEWVNTHTWVVRFPDHFLDRDTWNETSWASVVTPTDAFASGTEVRDLQPAQREAMERQFRHDPVVILRSRARADFVAFADGQGKVGETAVEYVVVHFAGATTRLAVDPATGQVLSASFKGRGKSLFMGNVEQVFSDFEAVGPLALPRKATVTFDGERLPSADRELTRQGVDGAAAADEFSRPAM